MKKIFSLLILCAVPIMGLTAVRPINPAETPTPDIPQTPAQEAVTLIHEGDALFEVRGEDKGAAEAAEAYAKAIEKDPTSIEAYWKSARAFHWVGDHAKESKDQYAAYEKGIELAKKAIELEPKSVEAHFWLGANYGSYGEAKGVLKSLALVKPIRKEMDTVVRLNDQYQGGAGYRVLGVVDYKVPGFAGGSKKRALENLNKAIAIDSGNAFNQYYLAEYFDTVGDRYKALDALNALEALTPSQDVDAADLRMIQAKGRKLKKKLDK